MKLSRRVAHFNKVVNNRIQSVYAWLVPPWAVILHRGRRSGRSYRTPVLAFNHGAAPEIIEHGKTGFLVSDENEMAAVVGEAGKLDPEDCRRGAERFSPDRVAARYEAAYHAAIARGGHTRERARAAGSLA